MFQTWKGRIRIDNDMDICDFGLSFDTTSKYMEKPYNEVEIIDDCAFAGNMPDVETLPHPYPMSNPGCLQLSSYCVS